MSEVKIVYNIYVAVRKLWNAIFGKNGDGSSVELIKGNPTVTAEAPNLTSIEINGTSYKIELSPEQVQEAVDYYLSGDPSVFENVVAPLIAPEWEDDKAYKVGNLLTYQGKQYEVTGDDGVAPPVGTLPTDTDYFTERPVSEIIDMIKNGTIVTGHSQVADNLTPYSEDSGTTQENPFISQGTGTDNNSVIVTTGIIARQLEKQGNTIPVVQLAKALNSTNWTPDNATSSYSDGVGTFTATQSGGQIRTFVSLIAGHKYLLCAKIKLTTATTAVRFNVYTDVVPGYDSTNIYTTATTSWQNIMGVKTAGGTSVYSIRIRDDRASDWDAIQVKEVCAFDITSWNSSIITDLTSHPSHFSWYYNGSLAYDAGSLANCNGRYLECGQGRNLFNSATITANKKIGADGTITDSTTTSISDFMLVVPNKPIYLRNIVNFSNFYGGAWYDSSKNFISSFGIYSSASVNNVSGTKTAPANAQYVRVVMSNSYTNDCDVSLYYTEQEGGEGYNQHYDYIAPIRIDTGNETLRSAGSAKDVKLPSGVITRKIGVVDLGTLAWAYKSPVNNTSYNGFQATITGMKLGTKNVSCPKYTAKENRYYIDGDKQIANYNNSNSNELIVRDDSYSTAQSFKTAMSGVYLYYELADSAKTIEQGTPFSEYADINDYSYMAWFDTDGNLVSIPQGCKLFYPVDYKGFTDDLVMYTNGDATALAKNESITDSALNARGYYKMQDLSSGITIEDGYTVIASNVTKTGNVVNVSIALRNTSGATKLANSSFARLPASTYSASLSYDLIGAIAGSPSRIKVDTSGYVITIVDVADNAVVQVHASYIV